MLFPDKVKHNLLVVSFLYRKHLDFTILIIFFSCNSSILFCDMLLFLKCPSLPCPPEINLLLVTDTETETFNELVAIHTYYFSSWLVGVKSNIVNMSPNIVKA